MVLNVKHRWGLEIYATSFRGGQHYSGGGGIMGVSESADAQNMWDLQTLQCDRPPQQSSVSAIQTMVGLFNHRRTSVPAICLHTPTVQTLCHTHTLLPLPKHTTTPLSYMYQHRLCRHANSTLVLIFTCFHWLKSLVIGINVVHFGKTLVKLCDLQ